MDVIILLLIAILTLVIKKYLLSAAFLSPIWLLYRFHCEEDRDDAKVSRQALQLLRPSIYVLGAVVGVFALSMILAVLWDIPVARIWSGSGYR